MQSGRYTGLQIFNSNCSMRMVAGLCLTVMLAGCSTGWQTRPTAQTAGYDARLQALESGMQQLSQRMDALQSENQQLSTARRAASGPLETRPVRPAIVLASSPVKVQPPVMRQPQRQPVTTPPPAPVQPPRQQPASPPERDGGWVINLASYRNASYAARKQREFAGKGVDVQQERAEVNGKTIYRLLVPGFSTSRAARVEAVSIRSTLGLQSTWIARR